MQNDGTEGAPRRDGPPLKVKYTKFSSAQFFSAMVDRMRKVTLEKHL
jgi:hypothetical protein